MARRVKQRERILGLLRESSGPVDAHHLAATLDLHVTTVRFHLAGLGKEGLVRTRQLPTERVGRPRLGYVAVKEPSYTDLVALLAVRIGGTPTEREDKAFEVGSDWAGILALALAPAPTVDAGTLVIDALQQLGFETQSATNAFGTHSLTLCTCPLAEIARTNPEVVRGIQRGLIQRVLDDHADLLRSRYAVDVRPDPQDGNCLVQLVLRPEKGGTTSARDDGRVVTG
ncbi:ArsR family transcriptional regulator [Rhodococcus pyridinivorans]|uniref:helix-turn-helix transcriptional regulator n=1 Tax=Rhodococcus pyridinivorans TaxID=103816 RepID=UPI00222720F9|nr:ArsR family transcriptional regulator [Rhodococcus pyridinivorans]MCW3471905.1 ArsR family transcriptional regulator [Rhodococcus pyridinivorans]